MDGRPLAGAYLLLSGRQNKAQCVICTGSYLIFLGNRYVL